MFKKGDMDAKTYKALKGSIAHWERIRDGKEEEKGKLNCNLCQAFLRNYDCDDCIIAKNGYLSCNGTPFMEWRDHQYEEHNDLIGGGRKVRCKTCKKIAQKEIDFLKSLLKGETKMKTKDYALYVPNNLELTHAIQKMAFKKGYIWHYTQNKELCGDRGCYLVFGNGEITDVGVDKVTKPCEIITLKEFEELPNVGTHTITIDGQEIEISEQSYQNIKEHFCED